MIKKSNKDKLLKVRNAEYYSEESKGERKIAPRNKEVGQVFMSNVKNGSGIMAHKNPENSVILQILGCGECSWCDTKLCPHFGDVTRKKPHSNRICSQRVQLGVLLSEDGHKITFKKLLWLKQALEADKIGQHLTKEAMDGNVLFRDVYPWKKLVAEAMAQFVKHEEGSTVTVKKGVTPSDLADMLDRAKTVDAEVEDK